MAIGWNTSLDDILSNYPILDYDLTKFNSQAMEYGHTKDGVGYVIYNGNYVIYSVDNNGMAKPVIELDGTNETLNIIENEFKESNNPRSTVSRITTTWNNRKGTFEGNTAYTSDRRQYGKNGSQNRRYSRGKGTNGLERSSKDSNNNQEAESITFFLTPDGEIYGFVAPNGDIYLDETIISPEHPIHEYTHLWDRIIFLKLMT